jgi:ribosomal protein L11 methyltransferase
MKYIEVNITLGQNDPFHDLLVDALGNEGPYDSFVETPTGLKAYVQESLFDEDWLKEQLADIEEMTSCSYTFENLPDKNWNEEWEKQHKPVLVEAANGKRVWVRAPFHEHRSDVDYEIEIEPKMSFGTAHHQTTYMMLSYLTELELAGQRVLDMGCGTAVLAILAKIRGAEYVEAIDIDEWAYNNAIENAQRNGVALNVRIGDASLLTDQQFDLIIANINRNILLNDMAAYAKVLAQGGTLLLSGFYESDVPVLQQHAEALGLQLQQQKVRQSWAALMMQKTEKYQMSEQ